jgi:Fe-S-cluster containining protein
MKTDDWVTGKIQLLVDDTLFEMQLTVQANPVKPHKMLPVFQQVTNLYAEMGIAATKSEGKSISCKKGCTACCYHMIGLAEFETYHITEIIEGMPEPQQSEVKERIKKALAHFTETGWIERFENCADYSNKESLEVFLDYFKEGVPCPFLVDEACSIYDDRPLMCREYLVTSPAENCSNPTKENINLVNLPVRPSGNLLELGQKKSLSELNVIPLIMSLKWIETNPNNFPEKTGEEWMTDFFQSITKGKIPKESETN